MGKSFFNKNRKKLFVTSKNQLFAFILGLLVGSTVVLIIKQNRSIKPKYPNKKAIAKPVQNSGIKNNNKNKYDFYSLLTKNNEAANDTTKNVAPKKHSYFIVVGNIFNNSKQADQLKASLALNGFEANTKKLQYGHNNKTGYCIEMGPFASHQLAVNKQQQLISTGFKHTTIKKI